MQTSITVEECRSMNSQSARVRSEFSQFFILNVSPIIEVLVSNSLIIIANEVAQMSFSFQHKHI